MVLPQFVVRSRLESQDLVVIELQISSPLAVFGERLDSNVQRSESRCRKSPLQLLLQEMM